MMYLSEKDFIVFIIVTGRKQEDDHTYTPVRGFFEPPKVHPAVAGTGTYLWSWRQNYLINRDEAALLQGQPLSFTTITRYFLPELIP